MVSDGPSSRGFAFRYVLPPPLALPSHRSKHERVLQCDRYKYLAMLKVSLLSLYIGIPRMISPSSLPGLLP